MTQGHLKLLSFCQRTLLRNYSRSRLLLYEVSETHEEWIPNKNISIAVRKACLAWMLILLTETTGYQPSVHVIFLMEHHDFFNWSCAVALPRLEKGVWTVTLDQFQAFLIDIKVWFISTCGNVFMVARSVCKADHSATLWVKSILEYLLLGANLPNDMWWECLLKRPNPNI